MEKDEDKNLYVEFLHGNEAAFEEIIRKYAEKIIYFIYRFTNDIDISKDISQNVFLYVLLHKEKYKFKCSVKTYLYIIAKSQALNYIKKEKKKDSMKLEHVQESELLLDIENTIFDNLEKQELKNAIDLLPEKERKNDLSSIYGRYTI